MLGMARTGRAGRAKAARATLDIKTLSTTKEAEYMQHIECKPHHAAKSPCRMASEIKGKMDAIIRGMNGGRQEICKIRAFYDFSTALYAYTIVEIGKNPEKMDEIQRLNWEAQNLGVKAGTGVEAKKTALKIQAHGILSELVQIAISRMRNENSNGTASVFEEFHDKIFVPSRQELP
jgi:hypothetical protein